MGFGDSITAGHTFSDLHVGANDSYFDMLACSENSPIRDIGNAGAPGATTTVLRTRLQKVIDAHPDEVLVLAGTNDIFLGEPENTIRDLEQMRQRLDEAGIRYKFGTLPPSNLHPDATVKMNESIREWAADRGVDLIDYYTPLADADGGYRQGLSDDGMHPSTKGAAVMAATAAAALR